jgi:hypothetical protein
MFIGDVLKSKDRETGAAKPGEYYLKVTNLKEGQVITLKNGDFIDLTTPERFFNGLESVGKISPEQKQDILKNTPSFVSLKATVKNEKVKG